MLTVQGLQAGGRGPTSFIVADRHVFRCDNDASTVNNGARRGQVGFTSRSQRIPYHCVQPKASPGRSNGEVAMQLDLALLGGSTYPYRLHSVVRYPSTPLSWPARQARAGLTTKGRARLQHTSKALVAYMLWYPCTSQFFTYHRTARRGWFAEFLLPHSSALHTDAGQPLSRLSDARPRRMLSSRLSMTQQPQCRICQQRRLL